MINHEKTRLMTKIAIYEKNTGREDRDTMMFFKSDFISFKSFSVLVGATIALIMLFIGDFAVNMIDNLATITEYDFVGTGIKYLTVWIIVMLVYVVVSTFFTRLDYLKAEQRVNEYQKLLTQLDKIDN